VTFAPINSNDDHVNRANRIIRDEPFMSPFQIAIDTREQAPFSFSGMRTDSRQKYRPLIVSTIMRTLNSGDYSIVGYESDIAIERKSPPDAWSTFTTDRERFERELSRLQQMRFAAVVIECSLEQLEEGPGRTNHSQRQSAVVGKTCIRSIYAWSQRFPRVHWFARSSRREAELTTFHLLERFWLDRQKERIRNDQ
jgi:ERCC4-type nuclease